MKSPEHEIAVHLHRHAHTTASSERSVAIMLSHESVSGLGMICTRFALEDKDLLIATNLSMLQFFSKSNHNKYLRTTSCSSFIIFPKKVFLYHFFLVFSFWEISAKNKKLIFNLLCRRVQNNKKDRFEEDELQSW